MIKEDGFFLFCQPGVHLADDREVCTAVHGFSGHKGVLTIEHIVVTIPVANLGRVGNQFGELCRHFLNIRQIQVALVLGRDFQKCTVDDLFLIRPLGEKSFDDGFIGDFGHNLRHGADTIHIIHILSSNFCR